LDVLEVPKLKEFSNGIIVLLTHGGLYRNVSRTIINGILFLFLNKWVMNKYIDLTTFLLLVIGIVTEYLNTSIELLADKVQPNCDIDIRDVKDVASSATQTVRFSYIVYLVYFRIMNK
jgi:diacylglycerol kinase